MYTHDEIKDTTIGLRLKSNRQLSWWDLGKIRICLIFGTFFEHENDRVSVRKARCKKTSFYVHKQG